MARPQHYPSPSKSEFPDAIKLTDFAQRSAPPSYHSKIGNAPAATSAPRPDLRRQDTAEANLEPITPAKILREHVLARRKEQYARRDQGDVWVNRFVTAVKTFTVVGVVFMITWAAYKWWSLGPEYAPIDPTGGKGS